MNVLLSVPVAGWAVGEVYAAVTGRENPYTPWGIMAYTVGGLHVSALEAAREFSTSLFRAITAEDKETRDRAVSTAIITAPKIPEMSVPYYTLVMDTLESASDLEFIDRAALRHIRQAFDASYHLPKNAHQLERKWYQKWQHAFGGGGVDYRIKKKLREEKKSKSGGRSRTRTRSR